MPSTTKQTFTPGMRVLCRDAEWLVTKAPTVDPNHEHFAVHCVGTDDLVRGHEAIFLTQLDELIPIDPRNTELEADDSAGYRKAKLFLEAQIRQMPHTSLSPSIEGMGAFKPMKFQIEAVEKALRQMRPRLLLADAVGLGKTIEIGMILAELIARGRGDRILVLTKKAMLTQFQSELWNRFAIPLVRLDSTGIARLRLRIPASKNPFEVFHRVIISMDTLKDIGRYRPFLEKTRWDCVVIDEAHNVAGASVPEKNLTHKLARLLSRSTDSMLLATATPHNGKKETFGRLISLLDPSAIPDPKLREYDADDVAPFFLMRFKEDVRREAGKNFSEREVIPPIETTVTATDEEEEIYRLLGRLRKVVKETKSKNHLLEWGLYKRFLSSPEAFHSTVLKVSNRLAENEPDSPCLPILKQMAKAAGVLNIAQSSRYVLLLDQLKQLKWDGSKDSPRLLIFTESTVTQAALAKALTKDFGLEYSDKAEAQNEQVLATIHGGFLDTWLSKAVESFGTGKSPMRMLLATDVASEGVNLHHECHHIIHYDLPWSIIKLIQRNGRIDRFGQKRTPYLRYLMVDTQEGLLEGDQAIFKKLIEKVEEINRSTRTGESILRLYDPQKEEEYLAEKGLIAGDEEVLQKAETDRRNAEAANLEELLQAAQGISHESLSGDEPSEDPLFEWAGEVTATHTRLRLYRDRNFLIEGYNYLKDTPMGLLHQYQPLEVSDQMISLLAPDDLQRRLGAPGANSDVILGANTVPEEAWPEHGKFRLTHKPDRVQQAIEAAFNTSGFWSKELLHTENHPIMRWLVERLVMQVPRGKAPLVVSSKLESGEKCFCFIGQVSSKAGIPLITDAHAISFLPGGQFKQRSLQDALDDAGFDDLTNTGRKSDFNPEAMRGLIESAVEASLVHLNQLRTERRKEIDPRLKDEEKRLKAWYEKRKALQLDLFNDLPSESPRARRLKKEVEEMDAYLKDRNDNWRDAHYFAAPEPTTRLVLVIESTKN